MKTETWSIAETVVAPLGYRCIPIVDEAGRTVADCEYQSDHKDAKQRAVEAARLIAVSPRLLAFVKAYAEEADCGNGGEHFGTEPGDKDRAEDCWHCTAVRLVAEAEGRASQSPAEAATSAA